MVEHRSKAVYAASKPARTTTHILTPWVTFYRKGPGTPGPDERKGGSWHCGRSGYAWESHGAADTLEFIEWPRSSVGLERRSTEPEVAGSNPAGVAVWFSPFHAFRPASCAVPAGTQIPDPTRPGNSSAWQERLQLSGRSWVQIPFSQSISSRTIR